MRAHRIVAGPIKFFCNVKVKGLENIPNEGGAIICANHIAVRDVFLIGASCPRQIKFVAKKELFSIPIVGSIMRSFGAVKLDRGGNDVGAIRKSIELVENGDLICIFPQGHRFPGVDPAKTPIKNGAGLIAYRAKSDVIPVCIKTKKNKYAPFRTVVIEFGKTIPYKDLGFQCGGNDEYLKATSLIFDRIVSMGDFSSLPAPNENN